MRLSYVSVVSGPPSISRSCLRVRVFGSTGVAGINRSGVDASLLVEVRAETKSGTMSMTNGRTSDDHWSPSHQRS